MAVANTSKKFTYRDYLNWPDDIRAEIIDGKFYDMIPSPTRTHQQIVGALYRHVANFLEGHICQVFVAPFDVVLGDDVGQPDVFIVCDSDKIAETHVEGAPDAVFEVLSPGTAHKDKLIKKPWYERHGVRECFLIDPVHRVVEKYLAQQGSFGAPIYYSEECEDAMEISAIELSLELAKIFPDL